jgi:hypothetical protein
MVSKVKATLVDSSRSGYNGNAIYLIPKKLKKTYGLLKSEKTLYLRANVAAFAFLGYCRMNNNL